MWWLFHYGFSFVLPIATHIQVYICKVSLIGTWLTNQPPHSYFMGNGQSNDVLHINQHFLEDGGISL